MGVAQKMTILVAVQIMLIVSSFFTLVYFESQTVLAGNAVNVAGKNRALANAVSLEVLVADPGDDTLRVRVLAAIEDLERNIRFLKDGGSLGGIEIAPLPPKFEPELEGVTEKLDAYKGAIMAALSEPGAMRPDTVWKITRLGEDLVAASDVLATSLGRDTENASRSLILMQVTLGIINVATHLLMIAIIWSIFKRQAKRQARIERMASIGEFAAILAHDIRNPLGTIRNSAELLRMREGLPESAGKDLSRITRAIERISRQVDGTLGYLYAVPLELGPNRVLDMLRRSADAVEIPPNIALEVPGADCDLAVECDSEKIEIVFTNLLTNAVQAIGNRTGRIRVSARDGRSHVTVEFENSDARIPKENIPYIFDPLFTTKMEGTGLGLASCKNIIELHDGTIHARSGESQVTFTIRLPKRQGDGGRRGEKEDSPDR
ncbi:MAG: ATP-binding protein [Thaumarchaeota archaeon]|nr:ATP-binding protein [Nitrososphaerota archaeon]